MIVAHPDDEVLWSGGIILLHPEWQWEVCVLCRATDSDRASKFKQVLAVLQITGRISNLNDDPEQTPLPEQTVQKEILKMVDVRKYDLIITHSPQGEYTRHRRHEEIARAVMGLWQSEKLSTQKLWLFAYTDQQGTILPEAIEEAHQKILLPDEIWKQKYRMIVEMYGFGAESWEARTTPKTEAFWCFQNPQDAMEWFQKKEREI